MDRPDSESRAKSTLARDRSGIARLVHACGAIELAAARNAGRSGF